jgi:hypothetical protein
MPPPTPKTRDTLSADGLHRILRDAFEQIPDHRPEPTIPLPDALLSAFALFSLKDSSLLAFDARRKEGNLQRLYGIGTTEAARVPCDTQMRTILDPVDPEQLRPAFSAVFRALQRGKALEQLVFHEGCYLLALDGTGYFSSPSVHCDSCLRKVNKHTGEVTYSHQMLGAVLVHPDHKEVIPLAPEPIIKQDGASKNDCERNAAKRLLRKIRQEHPRLGFIVIEDGLASNAPHIRELQALNMHFILGVKPGDHAFLFEQLIAAYDEDRVTTLTIDQPDGGRIEVSYTHGLPLNESNPDLLVNFLQCIEIDAEGNVRKTFSWVTDLTITDDNALHLTRGGRARWKIENETFNTLKNQGYQFEHNFGHGQQNLSVVFAMLMMLAFLVDQTQQLCCPLFRAVWQKFGSKRALWDNLRSHFRHFEFTSMRHLYEVMLHELAKRVPAPELDTS